MFGGAVQKLTTVALPQSATSAPATRGQKTKVDGSAADANVEGITFVVDTGLAVDDGNGSGLLYGSIVGGGILLVAVIAAVAVFVKRRQHGGPAAMTVRNSKFSTGMSQIITNIPRNSAIFTDLTLSQNFHRCAAFDYLRHRTVLGELDEKRLVLIYDLLSLSRPQLVELQPLRHLFNQFLHKSVERDPARFINRSVEFIESAIADALLEDWIDLYAVLTEKAGVLVGEMYSHLNRRGGVSDQGATFPNYAAVEGGGGGRLCGTSDDYDMPAGFDVIGAATSGVYEEPLQRRSSYVEPGVGITGIPAYRPTYAEIADYEGFYELINNAVDDPLYAQPEEYWDGGNERIYEELKQATSPCRAVLVRTGQGEPLYQQIKLQIISPDPVYDSAALEPQQQEATYDHANRQSIASLASYEPTYDLAEKVGVSGGSGSCRQAHYDKAQEMLKATGGIYDLAHLVGPSAALPPISEQGVSVGRVYDLAAGITANAPASSAAANVPYHAAAASEVVAGTVVYTGSPSPTPAVAQQRTIAYDVASDAGPDHEHALYSVARPSVPASVGAVHVAYPSRPLSISSSSTSSPASYDWASRSMLPLAVQPHRAHRQHTHRPSPLQQASIHGQTVAASISPITSVSPPLGEDEGDYDNLASLAAGPLRRLASRMFDAAKRFSRANESYTLPQLEGKGSTTAQRTSTPPLLLRFGSQDRMVGLALNNELNFGDDSDAGVSPTSGFNHHRNTEEEEATYIDVGSKAFLSTFGMIEEDGKAEGEEREEEEKAKKLFQDMVPGAVASANSGSPIVMMSKDKKGSSRALLIL